MCKVCHNCIRILMMIFNFIFVLCGLGLFGMGLYFYLRTFFKNMGASGTDVLIGFYVIMGIGAFTLIVGACGCCGSYHESPCLLGTYFILLLLIFAAEIAGGVLVFLYRDKATNLVGKKFEKGKNELIQESFSEGHWMHDAQRTMGCCGYMGPSDYKNVPKSCCAENSCELKIYDQGCYKSLEEFVQSKWMIFVGIILAIALIELLGLFFSMCLCCTIRSIDYDIVDTRA